MPRQMPTKAEVRATIDARLAEAEQAMRDAAAAGVVPDELRAQHATILAELAALRRELDAAFGSDDVH